MNSSSLEVFSSSPLSETVPSKPSFTESGKKLSSASFSGQSRMKTKAHHHHPNQEECNNEDGEDSEVVLSDSSTYWNPSHHALSCFIEATKDEVEGKHEDMKDKESRLTNCETAISLSSSSFSQNNQCENSMYNDDFEQAKKEKSPLNDTVSLFSEGGAVASNNKIFPPCDAPTKVSSSLCLLSNVDCDDDIFDNGDKVGIEYVRRSRGEFVIFGNQNAIVDNRKGQKKCHFKQQQHHYPTASNLRWLRKTKYSSRSYMATSSPSSSSLSENKINPSSFSEKRRKNNIKIRWKKIPFIRQSYHKWFGGGAGKEKTAKVKTLSSMITTMASIKTDSEIAAMTTSLTPLTTPSGSSSDGHSAADAADTVQISKLRTSKAES